MLAAKQLRPTFKNFLIGIVFAAAWGALLFLGVHLSKKLLGHWHVRKLLEVGAITGGGLYLLFQPPLGKLTGRMPWWAALPFSLVYHVGAFPGVLVGRIAGLLDFAPATARPTASKKNISSSSSWTGRVVAEGDLSFLDMEMTRGETVFEVHEDGRTSSEKMRFWGWVDGDGNVHKGAGSADNDVDAKVIATLKDGGCFVGSKRIGYFEKSY